MTTDRTTDPKWLAQNTYIERRSGKRTLNKAGRVDLAHVDLLELVDPTIIQVPSPDNGNEAIVHTRVRTKRGEFGALGYANPKNCTTQLAGGKTDIKDPLPMAEARALSRALDLALNYGRTGAGDVVAIDPDDADPDQSDDDQQPPAVLHLDQHTARPTPKPAAQPAANADKPATPGQLRTIKRLGDELGEPIDTPADLSFENAKLLITTYDQTVRDIRRQSRA